ncbi:hypothetical protein ABH975_002763 [Bradyrhizobium ottawaense]
MRKHATIQREIGVAAATDKTRQLENADVPSYVGARI